MAKDGKHLQIGGGSRRASQAKAEDAARRSRKRAGERRWRRDEEGRREHDVLLPAPSDNVQQAFAIVTVGLMGWQDPPEEES